MPTSIPKPEHLGDEYASQFSDASVVAAYPNRAPYPESTFGILTGLVAGDRRVVLDIGCGTGDIARPLATRVERVDAVDISPGMIELGQRLPGGDAPRLRWLLGRAEDTPLDPPYGLVTAGASLHWMDWDVVLPRLASVLAPGAVLAIVDRVGSPVAWKDALEPLFARYSTNRKFQPYDLVQEIVRRALFTPLGETSTPPVPLVQPVDAYIEALHSSNGFSRDRMEPPEAAAFDAAVRALVTPHAVEGRLHLAFGSRVQWGTPHAPGARV